MFQSSIRLFFLLLLLLSSTARSQSFHFELLVIDNNYNNGSKPGWSRMGDMDHDGKIDVVAGGGNYIGWYKNPTWKKQHIGAAGCNGGILFDVDSDGDYDVITSVKNEGHRLFWFENPNQRYPVHTIKENWTRCIIDNSPDLTFQHDAEIGDIDMDGVPDDFVVLYENYRTKQGTLKWYRLPEDPKKDRWEIFTIAEKAPGGVGLAIGDINGDGLNDVVRGGTWYEAPDPATGQWSEHVITEIHLTNVRIADLDRDGDLDIAAASGWQDKGQIVWMENRNNGAEFAVHTIAVVEHPENVVVLDVDADGDYEIITGEMKGEYDSTFLVFENDMIHVDTKWKKHIISSSHGICARMNVLDFDGDGDQDIVCDGNAQSHIYVWINKSKRERSTDVSFQFYTIDSTYAPGWVRSGDMDNDGDIDIIAGGGKQLYIYENNGKARGWKRHGSLEQPIAAPIGCNAAVIYDVDDDNDLDIIASRKYTNLGWWENPGGSLKSAPWTYHMFHDSKSFYLHDMIQIDIDKDGTAEEIVANLNRGYWTSDVQIKWFRPESEMNKLWDAHAIEPGRMETYHGHAGLDCGDINGDGFLDISYANGWYEGTGNPGAGWTWHEVTGIYGISNTLIRDFDRDGDMDLVMSAGHHGRGVYWFESAGTGENMKWKQHTIDPVTHNPEGLQSVDIDNDGDFDVLAAELFFGEAPDEYDWSDETHNLYLFRNHGGSPPRWEKINIAPDKRPCHSFLVVDINEDGKLDIIAESSGAPGVIYIKNVSR